MTEAQKPIRIKRERKKGWKLPKKTVVVTRPGVFGNPFYPVHSATGQWEVKHHDNFKNGTIRQFKIFKEHFQGKRFESQLEAVSAAVEGFRILATESPKLKDLIKAIKGYNVCCWCKIGDPCHGDVILEIANESTT